MQQKPWKGTEQRPPHQLRHHHLSQALPARFPQENQEQSLSSLSKQAPASPFHEDRFQQRFPYLGQLQHLGVGPLPVLKAGATHLAEIPGELPSANSCRTKFLVLSQHLQNNSHCCPQWEQHKHLWPFQTDIVPYLWGIWETIWLCGVSGAAGWKKVGKGSLEKTPKC